MRLGPAIGLIETSAIARGMVACDAMVKRAKVDVLESCSVSPGKFLILVAGEVAEVEEAMDAGLARAAEELLDELFLPHPHSSLVPGIRGRQLLRGSDAVGIIETSTIASTINGADACLKGAEVELLGIYLATGIGGKAYFLFGGALHDVEAGARAALASIDRERLVSREIIARPHEDFLAALIRAPRPVHPGRHS